MKTGSWIKLECLLIIGLGFAIPALANGDQPVDPKFINARKTMAQVRDTVPPANQPPAADKDKAVNDLIKEVPKARIQTAPVPVKIQLTPIKIVKPKIVKPVIKIVH